MLIFLKKCICFFITVTFILSNKKKEMTETETEMKKLLKGILFLIQPEPSYDDTFYVCSPWRPADLIKFIFWVCVAILLCLVAGAYT